MSKSEVITYDEDEDDDYNDNDWAGWMAGCRWCWCYDEEVVFTLMDTHMSLWRTTLNWTVACRIEPKPICIQTTLLYCNNSSTNVYWWRDKLADCKMNASTHTWPRELPPSLYGCGCWLLNSSRSGIWVVFNEKQKKNILEMTTWINGRWVSARSTTAGHITSIASMPFNWCALLLDFIAFILRLPYARPIMLLLLSSSLSRPSSVLFKIQTYA